MRGKFTLVAGLLITTVLTPATGRSEEPEQKRTMPGRSFSRFEFEAETHRGYWAELGAFLERTDIKPASVPNTNVKIDTITAFARFAYGGDRWEGNLFIPYRNLDGSASPDGITPRSDFSQDGLGDIELSGRFIPLKTVLFDAGAGLNLRLPSGDIGGFDDSGIPVSEDPVSHRKSSVDPGLPAGELGVLPFFTAQLHMGIFDVRGHIGYQVFTGSNHDGHATDRLIYGFAIVMPIRDLLPYGDYISLRNEFTNIEYSEHATPDVANYQVGFDIRIPVRNMDLILRPTGQVPISQRAPDWGLGGSIVLAAPTMVATKKVQMVGGVVVEE